MLRARQRRLRAVAGGSGLGKVLSGFGVLDSNFQDFPVGKPQQHAQPVPLPPFEHHVTSWEQTGGTFESAQDDLRTEVVQSGVQPRQQQHEEPLQSEVCKEVLQQQRLEQERLMQQQLQLQ